MMSFRFAAIAFVLSSALLTASEVSAQESEATVIEELNRKSEACAAVSPRTRPSALCAGQCARSARTLGLASSVSAEQVAAYRDSCEKAYVAAGFPPSGAPAPIAAPTREERLAAMPEKAEWCEGQLLARGCSSDLKGIDYADPEGACFAARACAMNCARSEDAAATGDPRKDKAASRVLSFCEQNYERLKVMESAQRPARPERRLSPER